MNVFTSNHGFINIVMITLPQKFNFPKHIFEINKDRSSKFAYIDDTRSITYGQLESRSRGLAKSLLDQGICQEDKVLIAMTDTVDFPVAFLGCLLAGIVPVLANPRTVKSALEFYVENSNAKAIISSDVAVDTFKEILNTSKHKPKFFFDEAGFANLVQDSDFDPPTTNRDAEAYWLFTSGGSGEPKAVVHSHGALAGVGHGHGVAYKYTDNDVVYATAKLFFAYGICHSVASLLVAGSTAILASKIPTPASVKKTFDQHKPTIFVTVPSMYVLLLNSGLDLSNLSMRACISSGEMLPTPIWEEWERVTGTELYVLYGTTEFTGCLMCNREGTKKIGTVGKETPGYEVEIRDQDGRPVDTGAIGDLYLKGPSMGMYYHNDLPRSRFVFRGEWCFSGDKFFKDEEGFYHFVGRSNDMMKVAGQWVSPVEIENILTSHPLIQEAGACGDLDENGLTQVSAHVVLRPGVEKPDNLEHQLKTLIRKNLEYYKCPKTIEVKESLPKNANGKLQRFLLKKTNS